MARHRRLWVAMAVVVVLVVAGWVVLGHNPDKPARTRYKVSTVDYLPGVAADTYLPQSTARAPVVVLIPGGGWTSANREGLGPLADVLAQRGIVAVNATYRPVLFPVPVADVVCAVDYAVERTRRAGIVPGRVVVLGHSAGAHLAALAALRAAHFRKDCPYPPATIDGLIGLSGAYDVRQLDFIAETLFGVSVAENPAVWHEGNPMEWAKARPEVQVLLAHGTADDTVPRTFTTRFATALEQGGHRVRTELVEGATHASIYPPSVIANIVVNWVRALA